MDQVKLVERSEPLKILIICENAKQMKRWKKKKRAKRERTNCNYLDYLFERH